MTTRLKVGLVGAGVFAGYHAHKVSAHDRAHLSGIFDPDIQKSQALAETHDTAALTSLSDLVTESDAVIVACPASYHAKAAIMALEAGCHVLIEKPLATTVMDSEAIVRQAASADRIIQVGHQERIVMETIGLHMIEARPTSVRIVRNCPRGTRNLDTSIILDMMIHDLDLLGMLFGKPDWVSTEQARKIYSDHIDEARAELGFGEMTAYVQSSRNAEAERRWTLQYESGTVEIDFAAKTLRHDTSFSLNAAFGDAPQVQDSLGAAFDRFVSACLDRQAPLATGTDGLEAVRLATMIEGDL